MTLTADRILGDVLAQAPDAAVLVVAHALAAPFLAHQGQVWFVGEGAPGGGQARDFRHVNARLHGDVWRALRGLVAEGATFDVIFIDHDHRLTALGEQAELCLQLAHDDTLLLFDDVLPPEYVMASAEPREGWWTGQVCFMRHLLRPKAGESLLATLACHPTGLLAAVNVALAPQAEFKALRQAAPRSQDELLTLTDPQEYEAVQPGLFAALARAGARQFVPVTYSEGFDEAAETRWLDEEAVIERRGPRFVAMARAEDAPVLDVSRLSANPRQVHGKFMQSFDGVIGLGNNSFYKDGRFITRYSRFGARDVERMALSGDKFVNEETGLVWRGGRAALPREALALTQLVPGRVMFATPDEVMNYGMWLLLVLPAVVEFTSNRDRYDYLVCHCPAPWQKAILHHLGVGEQDLIEHTPGKSYAYEHLTLIRQTFRDLYVTASDRVAFERAARALGAGRTGAGRRVFLSRLSRTRAGSYRGLMNEGALVAALAETGFEIVEPELLSFKEQMRLFGSVSTLVGLGGAGMFNAVFCRPGVKLVDIESGLVHLDAHCNLFASLGADYAIILGEEDRDDPRPVQKRWWVDVDKAVAAVCALEASGDTAL
jgi:hypothetical protein